MMFVKNYCLDLLFVFKAPVSRF